MCPAPSHLPPVSLGSGIPAGYWGSVASEVTAAMQASPPMTLGHMHSPHARVRESLVRTLHLREEVEGGRSLPAEEDKRTEAQGDREPEKGARGGQEACCWVCRLGGPQRGFQVPRSWGVRKDPESDRQDFSVNLQFLQNNK